VVHTSDDVLFNIAVFFGNLGGVGKAVLLFILFNNAISVP
jgi:hypothetical protein